MLPTESLDGKPSHITPCHTERSKQKSLKGCKKKQLTLPTKTRGNSHEIDCRRSFKDFFFKMPPHYLGKYEIPNFLKNRALNIFSKICLRIIFVKWVGWESILAPEGISSTGRSVADVARQKQGGVPRGVWSPMGVKNRELGGGNSNIFYFHPEPWGNDPF